MSSPEVHGSPPGDDSSAGGGALVNGRYRISHALGRGGMGTVYLAFDLARWEEPVALKCVRKDRLDARALAILRNEFLSLASMSHPNLVRAHDFGVDHETGGLFFTLEYVKGTSWLKVSQSMDLARPEDFARFIEILAQVLRALEFVHYRGLVHADVKPENVLITTPAGGEKPVEAVKLIDFGLARTQGSHGGNKILGTPYYVAPEIILGAPADRRSDLYSLGVVLYHLLAGEAPFKGPSNLDVLKSHVEKLPQPLQERSSGVPPALCEIIHRLLKKEPEERFSNALEVIAELNRALQLTIPLETPATSASYVESTGLVGRESDVARLASIFLAAAEMQPAVRDPDHDPQPAGEESESGLAPPVEVPAGRLVVLSGEKGIGKRRLVEELRFFAQTHGASFLEVECLPRARKGSGSLQQLIGKLAALSECGGGDASFHYLQGVVLLLRELQEREVDSVTRRDLMPEEVRREERIREGQMLEEIARQLLKASRGVPAVIHFHDLHLAGESVLGFVTTLVGLASEGVVAGSRILATATALDHGQVDNDAYHAFRSTPLYHSRVLEMKLQRLGEDWVSSLIERAFKGFTPPRAFVQKVLDESDGNPEVVSEILRFFLERRKLARIPSGWVLAPDFEDVEVPGKVRRELKERILSLPPEAMRLAMAFACIGDACELQLAAQLSGLSPAVVLKSAKTLHKERILLEDELGLRDNVYSFVHSSARVILYNRIDPSELPLLHSRAGDLLEARSRSPERSVIKDLAHHYLEAGHAEKATRYGLEAARVLAEELAPLQAIETYEKVLALVPGDSTSLRASILREIAALRFQLGHYRGVLEVLGGSLGSVEGAGIDREHGPAYLEAARAHLRLGEFAEALKLISRSVQPGSGNDSVAELARMMLVLGELHLYKGNLVESIRSCERLLNLKDRIQDAGCLAQVHLIAAEARALLHDFKGAVAHSRSALELLEGQRDARHLPLGLICRGRHYAYKHMYSAGIRQFQLCLLLRRKMSDFEGQAECLRELGTLHHIMGRQADARQLLQESVVQYRRSGNVTRSIEALCMLGEVRRLLGEHHSSEEALVEASGQMAGREKAHLVQRNLLTRGAACIDRGELEEANEQLLRADAAAPPGLSGGGGNVVLHLLFSELALHKGDLGKALAWADEALVMARQLDERVLLARTLIHRCYLACRLGRTSDAWLRLPELDLVAQGCDLPWIQGWMSLIQGMAHSCEGNVELAEQAFSRSVEVFSSNGDDRDFGHLYLEQGLLFLKVGDSEHAYLAFEEGLHLAEQLGLRHLSCRYLLAIGLLEASLGDGQASRAERNYLAAEEIARERHYPELLWQARCDLSGLLTTSGRAGEAEVKLESARKGLTGILETLPQDHRPAYLLVTGAAALEGPEQEERVEQDELEKVTTVEVAT